MTRVQMRQTVFEYIEVDYNRTKRHSTLGHMSLENLEFTIVLSEVPILTGSDLYQMW